MPCLSSLAKHWPASLLARQYGIFGFCASALPLVAAGDAAYGADKALADTPSLL